MVPFFAQSLPLRSPRSPLGPALLSGAGLSSPTPSGSQTPAPAPNTPGRRGTPPAHHPDFAPSTLSLPLAPQASAAPARNPSTTEQHAPRLRPLTAHDAGGAVRKASGERLATSGAHTSLSGDRRAWEPGRTPTRLPLRCDSRDKDCLPSRPPGLSSNGLLAPPLGAHRAAAAAASRYHWTTSAPLTRRSRLPAPPRPTRSTRPTRPQAHAGADLLEAETWQWLAAASAWGSWSRPIPGRAAGGSAPLGRKKLGGCPGRTEK